MDDVVGLRAVKAAARIPVAAGESWFGPAEVSARTVASGIDVVMLDLQRVGGVTGWRRAANASKQAEVSPHLFPEVSVHLMAAVNRSGLLEYVPWFNDLFVEDVAPRAGRLSTTDRPGLGLTFKPGLA